MHIFGRYCDHGYQFELLREEEQGAHSITPVFDCTPRRQQPGLPVRANSCRPRGPSPTFRSRPAPRRRRTAGKLAPSDVRALACQSYGVISPGRVPVGTGGPILANCPFAAPTQTARKLLHSEPLTCRWAELNGNFCVSLPQRGEREKPCYRDSAKVYRTNWTGTGTAARACPIGRCKSALLLSEVCPCQLVEACKKTIYPFLETSYPIFPNQRAAE